MDTASSPVKKVKSPALDNINTKTSVICLKVPEGLFDAITAKKHFTKFGRVQKIKLFPKRQMCIIEYDQPLSAERAVLNAGAFDGFMFDVTRTKGQIRRKSRKDDDPDWVPDSDVEEELSAMRGAPTYRVPRQKVMEVDPGERKLKLPTKVTTLLPKRKPVSTITRIKQTVTPPTATGESSSVTVASTSLSTSEAAAELYQLRSRVSLTPDEQWRTLDARDRILRAWGGAGSRVKVGGATIGTCPDMCPEKELLHRQAEHQVMTLETIPDSDGQLEPWRAVKQYSRSSADQEIPMCYELRPAHVLTRTCAYLLNEIADTTRQVTLADWFHFMWDRFRGIRKDITQQALCCADSIRLVETCARFHAHCAARLADLEHTQFDQKLNTDNLTKCLQTLKHMYADVGPELKPREAEFRGYIALLNLGDSNFWWEIKQLPKEIQKSPSITFAIQVFTALDNNNYVKFFRLINEKATYLQACILLRYFNDVRARALARIVKAYAPRGGSRYPANEIMSALAFESVGSMKSFVNHYGLRFSKTESELTIILDRNQFIEDSDPYPLARAVKLIESKRQSTVGEVIAGGSMLRDSYDNHILYSSFNKDGKLKETALLAEDLGYNTINDSNKDINLLKAEIQRLSRCGRNNDNAESAKDSMNKAFREIVSKIPNKNSLTTPITDPSNKNKSFSFQPAIVVAPPEVMKTLPVNETKGIFSFSKPHQIFSDSNIAKKNHAEKAFFSSTNTAEPGSLFRESKNNIFKQTTIGKSLFKPCEYNKDIFNAGDTSKTIFTLNKPTSFNDKDARENHTAFNNNIPKTFENSTGLSNSTSSTIPNTFLFGKLPNKQQNESQNTTNIFKTFSKPMITNNNIFGLSENVAKNKPINAETKLSPSSLFKNACQPEKVFSFFPSKNKAQTVADSIFKSVQTTRDVYEFQEEDSINLLNDQKANEAEAKLLEVKKKEEETMLKMQQQEEIRRREEELKKLEKQKQLEEIKKKEEEKKQEELRIKKLEQEKKAELQRKALEEERIFKEKVERDSQQCLADLLEETNNETIQELIKEELEKLKTIVLHSQNTTDELIIELCQDICMSEIKAEIFWTQKLLKKWFYIWKKQFLRNKKRRNLLEDTPVWLTDYTPIEEAQCLKRLVEISALKNMNAIHKGYKFSGELNEIPSPDQYNIMEIIRSPLLKRMKQINYPYDKCFFWKVALVSTISSQWLLRRVNIENWLRAALGDKNKSDNKDGLIYVRRQSWNYLMDFAISVSLTNRELRSSYNEALEGANGFLFYADENISNMVETIQDVMKSKYPYQIIPVAVVIPKLEDSSRLKVEENLNDLVNNNVISGYRLFIVEKQHLSESLHSCTKCALKWLARKCPKNPSIEIDYLKSICQRYLGNEIWHKLRSEGDARMASIQQDLNKLVNCYNVAVDKLTEIITNQDLFNYPSFPLEFNQYLDHNSPYPKPYEFIPSSVKQPDNIFSIKRIMHCLKLTNSASNFRPSNAIDMQQQISGYCKQIGWFDNPEKIASKVVAILPNNFFDVGISCDEFSKFFEQYNLIDFLNIVVYEKINSLHNFENICAIYEKVCLEEYRNVNWIYDIDVFTGVKHKAVDCEDDIDIFISAKRRKLELSKMEYLIFEEKDCTLVEESITAVDNSISSFIDCSEAMIQLEKQLEEEKKKSDELENLLRAALSDV